MFGFGKKKSKEGTEEQLHETMNFGGFGGLKRTSSPSTTEQATRSSGKADLSILDEVEKYDENIFVGANTLLTKFRKNTEAGKEKIPKDYFKSVVDGKGEYFPEVKIISAYLFYHFYKEIVENKYQSLPRLLLATKELHKFVVGRENSEALQDFSYYFLEEVSSTCAGYIIKENPAKKEELFSKLVPVAGLCGKLIKANLSELSEEGQQTSTPSSSSPTNGKPFEDGLKRSGKTVEQVMKEMGEDVAPVFYKKDPKTFSQVANYFYAIFLKLRDNLKQGNEIELDLDVKIPVNMLKSSAVFSKDTATSYITSAFNVATSVFINIDTRDLKAGERLSLVQLTASLIGSVGENCDKLLGMEAKKQVPEKNGEDKKDLKQISEALQNNPNIPDDLKKSLKEITSFFTGETSIAEMQFKGAIESLTGDQMKAKYLETLEGNIFTATFENKQFKEFYPDVNALKAELKNVDRYIEFYAYGIFANTYTDDRDFALTKFSAKLGEADHTEIAAMVFGTAMSAVVQHRAGKESIHHSIFSLVAQFLEYKKKEKAETKAQFAEGFKERGIEVSDSILDMVSNFAEEYGRNKVKEASSEQPEQEVKEAPKSGPASFFADKPKKTKYELRSNFAKEAENIAGIFKQVAEKLISDVRQASTNGDNIENVFKHFCYQHVIRYHLQSAAFAQPALMESILYYCQGFNRPDLHLVEMVTLAHWKPLLEIAYQELYVPVLIEQVKSLEDQNKAIRSFHRKARSVLSGMKDRETYRNMTDEEIVLDFLEVIPFYQVLFLTSPFNDSRDELSPLITEGKDYLLKQSGKYNKTWITTTLLFAYENALDMRGYGKGIGLDQYPNQGPNFALLMLFFFHQINMDVNFTEENGVPFASGMEQRYPLEIIPDVEPVKENMMIAMAGSHVFEELVPDLESSKATENKVDEVEQSEGGGGKFSALFKYMEENKDEIAFRTTIKGLKESPIKEKYTDTLDSDTLKAAIVGLELGEYFPDFEQTEKELRNDDKYIDFYVVGVVATSFTQNKELALAKFSEKLANASNTEIAAMIIGVGAMAGGLANAGKTSYHKDLFVLAQEHLAKNSSTSNGQTNDGNTEPSPAVMDLMGNLATLTKGLMGLEGISEEGKQQLAEQLGQLSKMGFSPNEQVVQERYGQAKSVAPLPWFDECGIQSSSFDLLKSVVRKYYPIDKKDNDKGLKLIETKFSNTDYWRIADSPFGQAMIYAGLAIHVGINNKWKGMTEAFMGLKDILTWIDNLEESRKDKDTKYMFLNIPLNIIRAASDTPEEIMSAIEEMVAHAESAFEDKNPAVNDALGSIATLTKALLASGMGSDEDKATLRKNLEELERDGFHPREIPESEEESSGFSPEKAKEIKSKMLPWFKNSGVVIDDDILALSLVINKIIEAEKNGYTDPQETAKKFSSSRIFQELYSTEFGQAVFYSTFAIVNTIDREEFLVDMINGYLNILSWVIQQEERAKKGFYIVFLSGLVEIAARTENGVEELKSRYDNIMQDFLGKVHAWGKEEGVSPEIMELK